MDDIRQGSVLLNDISDKLTALAVREGINPELAENIGREAATFLADDWGGQSIYIPMDLSAKLSARNEEIYKLFTGDNISELAKRFGLSVQTVYRIVKAERFKRAPRQASLFTASM